MVCPFRIETECNYQKMDDGGYLIKEQKLKFPECYEEQCPFFYYPYNCKRAEIEGEDY